MASNTLRKPESLRKPPLNNPGHNTAAAPGVEDVQFAADYDIPTLSDIADVNPAPARQQRRPQSRYSAPETQIVNAGTIILSPELLRQITEEVKREVLRDVRAALRTTLSRAVCQTVGVATRDMRSRIQKQIEEALPEMIEDTVFKRRNRR